MYLFLPLPTMENVSPDVNVSPDRLRFAKRIKASKPLNRKIHLHRLYYDSLFGQEIILAGSGQTNPHILGNLVKLL